jgi:hypothetical protein
MPYKPSILRAMDQPKAIGSVDTAPVRLDEAFCAKAPLFVALGSHDLA